ncbi:MAG: hypothetical protein V3T92_03920, partial [Anaerolineae bacterium]
MTSALLISKKSIPLFGLRQRIERLGLGDAELHYWVIEPGQRCPFGIQLVQQWLEFVLTWEEVKDDVEFFTNQIQGC